MPLDVWLTLPTPGGANSSKRHIVAFTWNGEFEFLSRFWPKDATRGAVDLYGDALFRDEHLLTLRSALVRATTALALQPDTWREHIGDQIGPTAHPIHDQVTISLVAEHLDALLSAVDQALLQGGVLEFVGD